MIKSIVYKLIKEISFLVFLILKVFLYLWRTFVFLFKICFLDKILLTIWYLVFHLGGMAYEILEGAYFFVLCILKSFKSLISNISNAVKSLWKKKRKYRGYKKC